MDALLNALNNENRGEVQDQECPVLHVAHSVRTCEFCGSTNTPTWRRGPAGKASLCNACGIKWRLRKRLKKGDEKAPKDLSEKSKKKKERKEKDLTPVSKTIFKAERSHSDHIDPERDYRKKGYFCKYCNKTWAFTQFKNSQQFGAHCSNCSRRPRGVKGPWEVPSASASPISDQENYYSYEEYHDIDEEDYYGEEESVYSPIVPHSPTLYHEPSPSPLFSRLHQIVMEETPVRQVHVVHEELYDFKSLQQLASIAEDARIRQRSVLSCLASIVAS